AAADHELSAGEVEFARFLHSETDGHPFCVEEVLLQLAEAATSSGEEGNWMLVGAQDRLDIPEGVREVVAQRLARLPDGADAVLEAAAVIGRQFDVRLLSAVADDGMRGVVGALDAAERARLIGPVQGHANRYRFAH